MIKKTERLAPDNGLLLNALHDKAFDRGLITITKDLKIVVSGVVGHRTPEDEYLWRYDGESITLPKRFAPRAEFIETTMTWCLRGRRRCPALKSKYCGCGSARLGATGVPVVARDSLRYCHDAFVD